MRKRISSGGASSAALATMLASILVTCVVGCSKSSTDKASPAASASAAPLASASAAAPASSGKAPATEAGTWSGSYVAKVGPVAPPENAKEKAWTNDPGTDAVGKGAIALSIAGSRGDTQGELTGPLGDLKISGVFDGTELRASLLPKDPKAEAAMTGFMVLAASGGPPPSALKGTLRVSNRDARIVREANVELAKK
jgi:hypothetical protein